MQSQSRLSNYLSQRWLSLRKALQTILSVLFVQPLKVSWLPPPSATTPTLIIILDKYELLECLGAEASGKVYLIYLARWNDWHEERGLVYHVKDNKGEICSQTWESSVQGILQNMITQSQCNARPYACSWDPERDPPWIRPTEILRPRALGQWLLITLRKGWGQIYCIDPGDSHGPYFLCSFNILIHPCAP